MKNTPLVSVLMPAYNSELYIAEAIQSILNQTYQNFELIIFDDGSSDKTRQVIEGFTDPRIVTVLSDQNFGVVRARNEMIDRASGTLKLIKKLGIFLFGKKRFNKYLQIMQTP